MRHWRLRDSCIITESDGTVHDAEVADTSHKDDVVWVVHGFIPKLRKFKLTHDGHWIEHKTKARLTPTGSVRGQPSAEGSRQP